MSLGNNFSNTVYCSFCKRSNVEVQKIIAGFENSSICNQCVNICQNLLREYGDKIENHSLDNKFLSRWRGITPKNIKKTFDSYIIGQEKTKKVLSVAVYSHYKKIEINLKKSKDKSHLLEKSNILLIGPTGSGKTLFAKTLAKYLDVPFTIVDATTLTQAGYVGEDVENILTRLLESAEGNIKKAELGIVYIDEIDKIAKKVSGLNSGTRDISGEGVQQSLLKIVEGNKCLVPKKLGKKHTEQDFIQFNTENILFICAGSFVGLNSILNDKHKIKGLGFDNKSAYINEGLNDLSVQPEDLISFGIIPEFIGRFPVIGSLNTLTERELYKILTNVKNSILNQYKTVFLMHKVNLTFTKKGLDIIIKSCNNINVGARGLKVFVERIINILLYNIDRLRGRHITLDDKFIIKTIK